MTLFEITRQLNESATAVVQQSRNIQAGLILYFLECLDSKWQSSDEAVLAGETLENVITDVRTRLDCGEW